MSFGLAWIVGRERRARRRADAEHAAATEARDRARMGGTISVDSAPGVGSTFTVELPVDSG